MISLDKFQIKYKDFEINIEKELDRNKYGEIQTHYSIFKPDGILLDESDLIVINVKDTLTQCYYTVEDYLMDPKKYD